jgi:hypothetical protein
MADGVLAAIGYIVRELRYFRPVRRKETRTRRSRAAGGGHEAVGQVAYALIPSILGTARDLAGELRAVLGVCIGLQPLAAMMMALGSLSKRSSLRKADQDGGGH